MRKYLFNAGMVSAIFSALGIVKNTIRGPRDWRLVMSWIGWAVSLAMAIGAITAPDEEEPSAQDSKKKKSRR
ncbi:MAG: hypothetical protein WBA28_00370 [Microbacteriaceae bacterium]